MIVDGELVVGRDGNGVLWCGKEKELLVSTVEPVFALIENVIEIKEKAMILRINGVLS